MSANFVLMVALNPVHPRTTPGLADFAADGALAFTTACSVIT